MAGGIQELGNRALALVLQKQLICLPANRGFIRLDDELPVFPLVAVWGHAIDGLAELGADEDGRLLAVCYSGHFIALISRTYGALARRQIATVIATVSVFELKTAIGAALVHFD